jgi:hypothetical protein
MIYHPVEIGHFYAWCIDAPRKFETSSPFRLLVSSPHRQEYSHLDNPRPMISHIKRRLLGMNPKAHPEPVIATPVSTPSTLLSRERTGRKNRHTMDSNVVFNQFEQLKRQQSASMIDASELPKAKLARTVPKLSIVALVAIVSALIASIVALTVAGMTAPYSSPQVNVNFPVQYQSNELLPSAANALVPAFPSHATIPARTAQHRTGFVEVRATVIQKETIDTLSGRRIPAKSVSARTPVNRVRRWVAQVASGVWGLVVEPRELLEEAEDINLL